MDDTPLAAFTCPRLTTVAQPFDAIAEDGLQRLIRLIEAPEDTSPPMPCTDPPIIVRDSTRQRDARGRENRR